MKIKCIILSILIISIVIVLISCSIKPSESPQTNESEMSTTIPIESETLNTDDSETTTGIVTNNDTETNVETDAETEYQSVEETTDGETYIIVPITTNEVFETEPEPDTETNYVTELTTDTGNSSELSLLRILESFNIQNIEKTSLICYSPDKDESGACIIITAVNNIEKTEATVTNYLFYENKADYEAAKQIYADPEMRDDEKQLIIDSVYQDDPVDVPGDFIFVSLFGYRLFA